MLSSSAQWRGAVGALVLVYYATRAWRHVRQIQRQLKADTATQNTPAQRLRRALTYAVIWQLRNSTKYLLVLARPVHMARIAMSRVFPGKSLVLNQRYGSAHIRQALDVHGVDSSGSKKARPVLIFVHGGTWLDGDKWLYGLAGEHLSNTLDALVIVINYRTFPAGTVLDMVQDVDLAVNWTVENIGAYGGDADQIFLTGHSAGAHLDALALIRSSLRVAENKQQAFESALHVRGFLGLAGPYDISDHYAFEHKRSMGPIHGIHKVSATKPAMLGEHNFPAVSPTVIVSEAATKHFQLPPFYLFHGTADEVAPVISSQKLAASLEIAHQKVELHEFTGCKHNDIVYAVMGATRVPCWQELILHYKRVLGC